MLRYALTSLRANATRLIATALAVVIGIGFLAAGLMLTDAMKDALTGNVDRQYADVDVVITPAADISGIASSVPLDVLDGVRATDGVLGAAGELAGPVNLLGPADEVLTSRTTGRAWIDVERLNPLSIDEGEAPTRDGEVVVDRGTASDHDLRVGSALRLGTPSGPAEFEVVGISSFDGQDAVDDGGTFSFAPDVTQDVLAHESPGWDDVLVATEGATDRVESALRDELPDSLRVESGEGFRERKREESSALLDLLKPMLQGFAYLALFVAGFVIFNTFSVVVTQRYRELALLRAVGGTPGQVRRSLLLEGAVVGLVASAIGVAFGAALSFAIQAVLGAFDIKLPGAGIAIRPWTIVLSLVAGTVVTVVSVFVPAFRAGRTKPVEAMRDAAVDHSGTSTVRAVIGGTSLVLSLALLLAVRLAGVTAWLLLPGALLLFVGLVVGGPLVALLFATILRVPARPAGLTFRLAVDNSARNPKRTATTANALVIGLFLVTLVTVSGDALRDYTVEQIDQWSSSDFIVASGSSGIAPDLVREIQDTDGVAAAAPVRQAVTIDPNGQLVLLSGTDLDLLERTTNLDVQDGSLERVADGTGAGVVALPGQSGGDAGPGSDAELAPVPDRVGSTIPVTYRDGSPVDLPVVATFELTLDTILLGTVVSEERFTDLTGDHPVTQVYVRVEEGRADAVGRQLNELVKGHAGTEVAPGNFLGQLVEQVFDFLINTVNALLGISVLIALIGIVNTLTLSIIERRRELGMVRSLGMTRQQVGRMVRMEAVLIGVLGTIIGVGAGLLLGWVVIGSTGEGAIDLNVDWARLALIALVGVLAGVLASILPARRATKVDMVEAMRSA